MARKRGARRIGTISYAKALMMEDSMRKRNSGQTRYFFMNLTIRISTWKKITLPASSNRVAWSRCTGPSAVTPSHRLNSTRPSKQQRPTHTPILHVRSKSCASLRDKITHDKYHPTNEFRANNHGLHFIILERYIVRHRANPHASSWAPISNLRRIHSIY